jgi:hypothetical protein
MPAAKKKNNFMTEPLAVGFEKKKLFLLFRKFSRTACELYIASGKYDTKFDGAAGKIGIVDAKNKKENIAVCSDFRFSGGGKNLILTYTRNTEAGKIFVLAESKNKKKWLVKETVSKIKTAGVVAPDDKKKSTDIYFGDHILKIARAKKEKGKAVWEIIDPPRAPHWNFFDGVPFSVFGGLPTSEGFAVFYCAEQVTDILKDVWLHNEKIGEERLLKIGLALFAENDSTRLLWQTELPIIEVPIETAGKLRALGIVPIESKSGKNSAKNFRLYTASLDGHIGFIDLPGDIISDNKNRKQVLLKNGRKIQSFRRPV